MFPWDAKSRPPNKKAENQLTEDVDILVALLAGTPPDQIMIAILLNDSSISELENIFCSNYVP